MSGMLRRILTPVAAVAVAGSIAACAPYGPPQSAAQRIGWVEGCDSGYSDASRDGYNQMYYRDNDRYGTDGEYHEAWDGAYKECYEEELRTPYMGIPDVPG